MRRSVEVSVRSPVDCSSGNCQGPKSGALFVLLGRGEVEALRKECSEAKVSSSFLKRFCMVCG